MNLSLKRKIALLNFLYDSGWISYEQHPDIHIIAREIEQELKAKFGNGKTIKQYIKLAEAEELKNGLQSANNVVGNGRRRPTKRKRLSQHPKTRKSRKLSKVK